MRKIPLTLQPSSNMPLSIMSKLFISDSGQVFPSNFCQTPLHCGINFLRPQFTRHFSPYLSLCSLPSTFATNVLLVLEPRKSQINTNQIGLQLIQFLLFVIHSSIYLDIHNYTKKYYK